MQGGDWEALLRAGLTWNASARRKPGHEYMYLVLYKKYKLDYSIKEKGSLHRSETSLFPP